MGIINDRKDFIGGTDAIRIMNGQWVDLYQEKLGIVEPEDLSDSLPVQLGIHTEQFNLDWWTTRHQPGFNMAGTRVRMQFGLGSGDLNAMHGVPMFGTADMMCIDSQNKSYLVEAKHTNSFTNMEGVLERYMPQLQFYMWLHKNFCQSEGFKDDGIYLSVIFGNSKWESKHISYDHAYTMHMVSLIVKFWRHVQAKMPPSNRDAETPDISSIAIDCLPARALRVSISTGRFSRWHTRDVKARGLRSPAPALTFIPRGARSPEILKSQKI